MRRSPSRTLSSFVLGGVALLVTSTALATPPAPLAPPPPPKPPSAVRRVLDRVLGRSQPAAAPAKAASAPPPPAAAARPLPAKINVAETQHRADGVIHTTYANGQTATMTISPRGAMQAQVDGRPETRVVGHVEGRVEGDARGLLALKATARLPDGSQGATTKLVGHDVPRRLDVGTRFSATYETNGVRQTQRFSVTGRDPRTGNLVIQRTIDGTLFVTTIHYDPKQARIVSSSLAY